MTRRKAPYLVVVRDYYPRSDLDQRDTLRVGQVFRNLGFFYLGSVEGFHHMIALADGRVFAYPASHFEPRRKS